VSELAAGKTEVLSQENAIAQLIGSVN